MKSKKKLAEKWAEAQEKCGLSDEAVQMAKESGIAPQVLPRKIPPESEPRLSTVGGWVRTVYLKRKAKEQTHRHSDRRSSGDERRLWFHSAFPASPGQLRVDINPMRPRSFCGAGFVSYKLCVYP